MVEGARAGSSLDGFLEEEGMLEEFRARAIKEVIAWQLAEAMRERGLRARLRMAMGERCGGGGGRRG